MLRIRIWAVLLLALPFAGCASGTDQDRSPVTASANFTQEHFDRSSGQYKRFPLQSVDRNLDPETGNKDDVVSFPEPGVIRLAGVDKCSVDAIGKEGLCGTRNEIRTVRGPFREPAFYRIGLRLAAADGGAINDARKGWNEVRLMIAQVKFRQATYTDRSRSLSPILALRFEDDQLFVTADMMAKPTGAPPRNGRCARGVIARYNQPGSYTVLLAAEGDRLPFDFVPSAQNKLACVKGVVISGSKSFPRQNRSDFLDIAMHINGIDDTTAVVQFYLGGTPIVRATGVLADGLVAAARDFKFGIYGDLAKGRQAIAIDYRDFCMGPTPESVGGLASGLPREASGSANRRLRCPVVNAGSSPLK